MTTFLQIVAFLILMHSDNLNNVADLVFRSDKRLTTVAATARR